MRLQITNKMNGGRKVKINPVIVQQHISNASQ